MIFFKHCTCTYSATRQDFLSPKVPQIPKIYENQSSVIQLIESFFSRCFERVVMGGCIVIPCPFKQYYHGQMILKDFVQWRSVYVENVSMVE